MVKVVIKFGLARKRIACHLTRRIDGVPPTEAIAIQTAEIEGYAVSPQVSIEWGIGKGSNSFCSQSGCTDGEYPAGSLVQATNNGGFYGTTQYGGAYGGGTVFKITASGTLTTLYSFCSQGYPCPDGETPLAGLVQGTDGNLYGITQYGGENAGCNFPPCGGTVFKITPNGTLTTLYGFCAQGGSCTDGTNPVAALVQATDGNFYGTTQYGGSYNNCNGDEACGTVFKITPSGTLTTLYSFCSQGYPCPDGEYPAGSLVQDTNGKFYGTTISGGAICYYGYGCGTVFSISVGLRPFVETQPAIGRVGGPVEILGTNLTGATSVNINGTAATFTVASGSLITTTVPEGATSGFVTVTTPSRTLVSNKKFLVRP
jgi:uncharacterized repeat protein (TIGR03803 family)